MNRFTKDVLRSAAVWFALWGLAIAAAFIQYGAPPA